MHDQSAFITYPTWKKYIVLSCVVEQLRVRDKRHLFHIMRREKDMADHNSFFPAYGFTAGELSVWQILADSHRQRRRCKEREG